MEEFYHPLNLLGWLGAVLILVAFYLTNYKNLITVKTIIINLLGGLALLFASLHKEAYFNVALNLVWVGIAILSLVKRKN
jgi:hypothetical protein